jgi:hypothetical protein
LFWADGVLNTIPSIGYMVTSCVALGYAQWALAKSASVAALRGEYIAVYLQIRTWNFAFDILFAIDALVYIWSWVSDAGERAAQIKETREVEQVLGLEYKLT